MNGVVGLVDRIESVHLSELPPLTTVLVWTWNSLYRFIVMDATSVYVQGGARFPDPTSARFDGASVGGFVMAGWICVGLMMELRVAGSRVITTPVLAISTDSRDPIVH